MNIPTPGPSSSTPSTPHTLSAHASQIRAWLQLHRDMAELHAKLEYLKLMVILGVQRARD